MLSNRWLLSKAHWGFCQVEIVIANPVALPRAGERNQKLETICTKLELK